MRGVGGCSLGSEKPSWRLAPLSLRIKGPGRGSGDRFAQCGHILPPAPDPHCWAMRSGHAVGAQTRHPPRAGAQGLCPTRRLQPWVPSREEGGSPGLASWPRAPECPGSLGQHCATLHFWSQEHVQALPSFCALRPSFLLFLLPAGFLGTRGHGLALGVPR